MTVGIGCAMLRADPVRQTAVRAVPLVLVGGAAVRPQGPKALRSSCSRLRHARKHRLLLRLGAGSAAGNLPVVQHSSAVVAMLPVSLGQTGCAAGGGRAPRA